MEESRIDRIRKAAEKRNQELQKKMDATQEKVQMYTDRIHDYAPRIAILIDLAQELVKNGLPLGKQIPWAAGFKREEFWAEGIYHHIGFIRYVKDGRLYLPDKIGIEGGGCDGYDIEINRYGKIMKNPLDMVIGTRTRENAEWDFFNKCDRFFKEFDDFERRVCEYVDSL